MDSTQITVNRLAKTLRLQIIEYLVKEDLFKFRGERLNAEDLKKTIEIIYKIPCCTRKLRALFEDAHRMHEDKGMMPHSASIGDLEWCMRYRSIGYRSEHSISYAWLPEPKDSALKSLPAFIELDKIYKREKRAIAPVKMSETKNINNIIGQIRFANAGA